MAVGAKAGIEQRLAGNNVRGALAADREPSGVWSKGNGGLPQNSHGTSVLASHGSEPRGVVSKLHVRGKGAGGPAPDCSSHKERPLSDVVGAPRREAVGGHRARG